MRVLSALILVCVLGCIPDEDRKEFYKPKLDIPLAGCEKPEPEGWIRHEATDCKFSFGQDVIISQGFYRGRTGAVMELRDDGYVIDVYGYRGIKPSGHYVHRTNVIYGVPEGHLVLDEKEKGVR